MRTTGGSPSGATSTRSRSFFSAISCASLMCLIPSCSPVSEIKRTERALICPLILGSSSVATLHHSFRFRYPGAVEPPTLVSETSSDHRPQTTPLIVPLPLSVRNTRRDLGPHPGGELPDLQGLLRLLASRAHVDRPRLGLPVPDYEQIRHLLAGVFADLFLHAVGRVVHLDAEPLAREPLLHLARVVQVPVGNRDDHGLHRREPKREYPRV